MQLSLLSLIYFIAFSHAMLLAVVLWRQTDTHHSGRLLAILMLLFGYKLFEGGVTYSNLYQQIPHVIDWLPGAVLFMGPIFYGYIRVVCGESSFTVKQWLIHLSPALLLFLLNLPSLFAPAEVKIANLSAYLHHQGPVILPVIWVMFFIILKLHLGSYLAGAWQLLAKLSASIPQLRADDSPQIIRGHQGLCKALFALETVWVLLFILEQTTEFTALQHVSQMWLLFMAVIVLSMGYYGLKQPQLFISSNELALIANAEQHEKTDSLLSHDNVVSINSGQPLNEAENKQKYQQSSLPESSAELVATLIDSNMRDHSLYLDDKLSLTSLASKLDLKPHIVSQVINQQMATNFYKMVNQYRISHAVDLMKANHSFSLERIAYESGFGNRVTFTNAFKQEQGCTPSVFRKQLKVS